MVPWVGSPLGTTPKPFQTFPTFWKSVFTKALESARNMKVSARETSLSLPFRLSVWTKTVEVLWELRFRRATCAVSFSAPVSFSTETLEIVREMKVWAREKHRFSTSWVSVFTEWWHEILRFPAMSLKVVGGGVFGTTVMHSWRSQPVYW